eukprot:GHVR01139803.1.p1 GENE.GHVR01139803.1~~GHVR01139803.1.p1  ORF type:complete len:138 (-),score=12.84 GHVR01139803.1:228-641(-)
MVESSYDHLFKILLIGDSGVGKSSILLRFTDDEFNPKSLSTIGVDFKVKYMNLQGKRLKLAVWDTAGQERFRSLIPNYMKDANCAVMVYDVTKESSLSNLKIWNSLFEEHQSSSAIKVIVGNKIDLSADRKILKKDG